ncbi:MAG: tetratricopeptide repeat protein [Anaerolineae bacterium]|nr:tetratricopeptide repeat protein [Anaerolineae bacterium]
MAEELKLYFFGAPRIERGGQVVAVDTRKALALAAYLALTGGAHRREALAALLWPDYEPERAYGNLRRTLWSLRQAVGDEWLDAGQDTIALASRPGLWIDVLEFRLHLESCLAHGHGEHEVCPDCIPALESAIALYRDDLLAGFSLRDAPAFDDWQMFQAEALRLELGDALAAVTHACIEATDLARAVEHARRRVALDPLNEAAHMQLMIVYAMMGDRAAALRQYEVCVRAIRKELGAEPDSDVELLRADILAGQFESAHRPQIASQAVRVPPRSTTGSGVQATDGAVILPQPPTSFVGRDEELADIGALLGNPACRLLSLVGPGGAGKSRLAVEAAGRAGGAADEEPQRRFPHGVRWVPLAGIADPDLIVPAVADAAGFSFFRREDQDPRAQLLDYLREKQMLLVLDNLEHLLDGAGLLTDLLAAAPGIKLLITSRERLNLQGEWVFQVGGMPAPGCAPAESLPGDTLSKDRLRSVEQYGAARLFLERACQANAHFTPDPADVPHLARICCLVDGMPLGLELAATWTRVLPLADIADEIERSLDFLVARDRDRPDRQRSQRAVFDHSWRFLSPMEQAVLARLSLFRGGINRVAACQAAGASLPILSALVDKSLLQARPLGHYAMHELVRQYAAEKLAADPEEEARTQAAHAAYFLGWLHKQEGLLKGGGHAAAAREISAEIENVRVAWHRALAIGRWDDVKGAAWSLAVFYDVRSRFEEGYAAFYDAVRAVKVAGDGEPARTMATEAVCVAFLAGFAARLYRVEEAMSLGQRARTLAAHLDPGPERALTTLVTVQVGTTHDLVKAEALLHESLDIFCEQRDLWGVAICLMNLADITRFTDRDVALGRGYLEASYRVSRQSNDPVNMANCLFALGQLAQATGDRREAIRLYGESLEIRRELGDRWGTAYCLDCMGYLARELGEFDEAYRLHHESLAVSREIGDQLGVAGSIDNLGLLARDRGELVEARTLLEQALDLRRAVGRVGDVAVSLRHVAENDLDRGQCEAAMDGFREALAGASEIDWRWEMAESELGLAKSLLAMGDREAARDHLVTAMRGSSDIEEWAVVADTLIVAAPLLLDDGEPALAAAALQCVLAAQASRYTACIRTRRLLDEMAGDLPVTGCVEGIEGITRTILAHLEQKIDT